MIKWLMPILFLGCLKPQALDGTFRCSVDSPDAAESAYTCPTGYVCDDRVCCSWEKNIPCPTFPVIGEQCGDGGVATAYYEDADNDGDGNKSISTLRCSKPTFERLVTNAKDCDDGRDTTNSQSIEVCNGFDDNCDGQIDEGLSSSTYYFDADGDGHGDTAMSVSACLAPPGYVSKSGDCDSTNQNIFPGAIERCNNVDDNCNQQADNLETNFGDSDAIAATGAPLFPCNSFLPGVCTPGRIVCTANSNGKVAQQCISFLKPNVNLEVCDGIDNNCDNRTDEQPACGGPSSLYDAGLSFGARVFSAVSGVNGVSSFSCSKAAGMNEVLLAPSRWNLATNPTVHVYWAEAPANTFWDLSNAQSKFRLKFQNSLPSAWNNPDGSVTYSHPIVVFCGANDTELARYRADTQGLLGSSSNSYDKFVTLSAFDNNVFLITPGSGFDLSRTKRVEIILYPDSVPVTVDFDLATGFSK